MANCIQCGRKLPAFTLGKKLCQWCVQHEAAQRGEEPEDAVQRVELPPWLRSRTTTMGVTQALVGINVAVFLAMLFSGVSMLDNPAGQDLVRWGANWGPLTSGGEPWRLLTCVFLHGSLLHIAFNMWCLWDLGALCESLYGSWTFIIVYLLTGIGSSAVSLLWNANVLSVGASGAIFGIAGALIASFYLGEFSLPRAAINATLRSVALFVGYNLFFGAVIARTDNAAHIGGLLSGLLFGALIARLAPLHDDIGRRLAVLLVGAIIVFAGTGWLLHSRAYIRHWRAGSELLDQGRPDQAIAELQAYLQRRPADIRARMGLAYAYKRIGDLPNAEAEYKRVIEHDPRNEAAYSSLGFIYIQEKRQDSARATFTRLLQINPDNAEAHFGMGSVLYADGAASQAIDEYKSATKLNPQLEGANYNIGQLQFRLKMYDEAIASLLKEREVSGDAPDLEDALARAYEAKGMSKEVAEAKQKSAELAGRH